jgi:hypothetical protein
VVFIGMGGDDRIEGSQTTFREQSCRLHREPACIHEHGVSAILQQDGGAIADG